MLIFATQIVACDNLCREHQYKLSPATIYAGNIVCHGHCRCKIEFWPHWISTRGVLIQRAAIKIQRIFHVELRPPETGGHCITTPPTDKILTPPLNCDPTQTVLSCCREFSFNLVPRSCLQFFDSFRRQMLCSNACSNTLKLTWHHICHRQIS